MPLILWASLWAHPRSAAHALSYLPLRRLYRSADAVVTYGPHVSAYVRARGARNVHVAPQSVDNDFWRSPEVARAARSAAGPPQPRTKFLFVGRPAREKGLRVLMRGLARIARFARPRAALVLVGAGIGAHAAPAGGAAARTRATASSASAALDAGASCATSTRPATCWSCRRSPRAPFASPGGWWSTRR